MRELIVVSDLHLGRGRNPATGRLHRLEAFFYDESFEEFCAWVIAEAEKGGRLVRFVLNGDTFDFLRVEHSQTGAVEDLVQLARDILAGHPRFVGALAGLLAHGHEVVILPGNHDLELHRGDVRAEVRAAIAAALGDERKGALAGLSIEAWFHHEPGRIWIEHGSQYDPEGAFRYPLRGDLDVPATERDVPLGNFFQRHLYNAFGSITFVVPSTEANPEYLRWLALHQPRTLARVLFRHLPFALRLLWRIARSGERHPRELAAQHEADLGTLASTSALGERLREIDALKRVGDLGDAAARVGRQAVRTVVATFLAVLLAIGLWSVGQLAIGALRVGLAPKAALSLAFGFVMLATGGLGVLFFLLRPPGARRLDLSAPAGRIAAIAGVPLVTFGHVHEEAIVPLAPPGPPGPGPAWYFNTGTWLAVFLGDELVPRGRVQFTFLRVLGTTGELLHWSPSRARALPAILLDG